MPDGAVWIAATGKGVAEWREGKFFLPQMQGNPFRAILEAISATPDGRVWLASYSHGLYSLSVPRLTVVSSPGSDKANNITALFEMSPGEFAVATDGAGILRYQAGQFRTLFDEDPHFGPQTHASGFLATRDGSLWVSGYQCLAEFCNGNPVPHPELDKLFHQVSVRAILEDFSDGIWAGTDNALYHIHGDTATKVPRGG